LRRNGFQAPIIMLTGHHTDSDTILGLESGANDYVTKPFRQGVTVAKVTYSNSIRVSEHVVMMILSCGLLCVAFINS